MLALVKDPKPNVSGNLFWHPPYLYPMDELVKGIEELRDKGYWVSLFPEGDGLAYDHEPSNTKIVGRSKSIIMKMMEATIIMTI